MKKYLIIFVVLFFSCNKKITIEKKYFKNGDLQEMITRKGNYFNGEYIAFYSNGIKREEGIYKKNRKIGVWKAWYKSGNLFSIAEYENNQLINANGWDENSKQTLVDGNGYALAFYPNGDSMSLINYTDCKWDGELIK
ncbi:MAG: hypothetical protein GXO89_03955, partial [Chlorobi bacterium]|nr:hypothetical protein [Chlorobiota bacterium]